MTSVIGLVVEQRLDRPEARDVVDQLLDQARRSSRVTARLCFVTTRSKIPSILGRTSSGGASTSESNAPTISVWRIRRISRISSSRAGVRGAAVARGRGPARGRSAAARVRPACHGRRARWRPCWRPAALVRLAGAVTSARFPSGPRRDSPSRLPGRTPERGSGPPMCRGFAEHNSTIAEVRCGVATELMWSGRVGRRCGAWGPGTGGAAAFAFGILAVRRGAIAQLGERLNGIQKVRGSNPLSSTNT